MRNALPRATLGLAAAALLLAAAPVWAGDDINLSQTQIERVGIETSRVEERAASLGLRFPARVVVPPNRTRLINAPLGGRIETMAVRIDESVRAGQVLAELQSPALAQAQAEFLVASSKEQLLRETFEREQSLAPAGAVPRIRSKTLAPASCAGGPRRGPQSRKRAGRPRRSARGSAAGRRLRR